MKTWVMRTLVGLTAAALCLAACKTAGSNQRQDVSNGWMDAVHRAWKSMADGGEPMKVEELNRIFVQAGMSESGTIRFVAYGAEKTDLVLTSLKRVPSGDPVAVDLPVKGEKLFQGQVLRFTVGGLEAGQRYQAEFTGAGTAIVAESATPPADNTRAMSFLAISCNEPWSTPRSKHLLGVPASAVAALRLLEQRASGKLPINLTFAGQQTPVDITQPSFLIGLGDQVYVDASPGEEASLALFGGERSDRLFPQKDAPAEGMPKVLDTVYRMHLLAPPMHRTLSKLPNAMVWDDHEIRDGWGNQGDEFCATQDIKWPEYFEHARTAAWAFEVARNPNAGGAPVRSTDRLDEKPYREMDTSFGWGDRIKVFMMDTRTRRMPNSPPASTEQIRRLATFLGIDPLDGGVPVTCGPSGQLLVVGTPIPLAFARENFRSRVASQFEEELQDDTRDEWWADNNSGMRKDIERLLVRHRKACPDDRLLILSGDVHESGIYAINKTATAAADVPDVIAFEVISSGIATVHDSSGLTAYGTDAVDDGVVRYSQIGRVAVGASFAEIVVHFPDDAGPPKVGVLFHSTVGYDKVLPDRELVNVFKDDRKLDPLETTLTSSVKAGDTFYNGRHVAELDVSKPAPESGEYGLMDASATCRTRRVLKPLGVTFNETATDWSNIFKELPVCVDRP